MKFGARRASSPSGRAARSLGERTRPRVLRLRASLEPGERLEHSRVPVLARRRGAAKRHARRVRSQQCARAQSQCNARKV